MQTSAVTKSEGYIYESLIRALHHGQTPCGNRDPLECVFHTPWTGCDREADYRQAWAEFERRLGKKTLDESTL